VPASLKAEPLAVRNLKVKPSWVTSSAETTILSAPPPLLKVFVGGSEPAA
jgi:hypothetical protein